MVDAETSPKADSRRQPEIRQTPTLSNRRQLIYEIGSTEVKKLKLHAEVPGCSLNGLEIK